MPYSALEHEGRIRPHGLTPSECKQRIGELLALADRDLEDAAILQRPADGRHNSAYEAARSMAEAVVVAEGYRRLGGEAQHKTVFEFLAIVADGMFAKRAAYFDKARRLRNKTKYDKAGIVSPSMAAGILKNARDLMVDVRAWLAATHPEFVGPAGNGGGA